MSEYADIKIENMSLFSFRNYVDVDIVGKLFCVNDLSIVNNYIEDSEDENAESCTGYFYKTTVLRAKERLDAQGYTLIKLNDLFDKNLIQVINYAPFLWSLTTNYTEFPRKAKERINKYKITFHKWFNSMKKIIAYQLDHGNIGDTERENKQDINITTECDKIIFYSLTMSESNSFYAIDTGIIDIYYIIRLILECCDESSEIILNFTYLQYWDESCIDWAISATRDIEKTIVLVEGTNDKYILEFSIQQLYPHLSDLFYFMDFDDKNGARDGGTSYVIKNLKTFYFSKIKRNFIAIFDNDAEGYSCKCKLLNEIKSWPSNFRILLYPKLDLFKKYPTIAPNGSIMLDDINKKAASIELYLPDFIIKKNDEYLPIEWESRKAIKNIDGTTEHLYQGVISEKTRIETEFKTTKNKIIKGNLSFNKEDWKRMQTLIESIVFAYRE